jgi:hypothetical protein
MLDNDVRRFSMENPMWNLRYFATALVLAWAALLLGCPPPNSPQSDTTPPGFVHVTADLEAPTPPVRGQFDITNTDYNRNGLANVVIRINAVAADQESGIASLTPVSQLTWQCSVVRGTIGHRVVIDGPPITVPLEFNPRVTSSSPPLTSKSINVVADPIAMTLKECRSDTLDWAAVNISGFVRVTATNGMNPALSVTSKTFTFGYAIVGGTH